jgi:hypothetical protein
MPTWELRATPRGDKWLLFAGHPPPPWQWGGAVMMLNQGKRNNKREERKQLVWMVHQAEAVHNEYGFNTTRWRYVTWTDTLDEAKSVAALLYASRHTGE